MLRRLLSPALSALALVAVGCSNAEEGGLQTRGDAMESKPKESVRPGPLAGITGGGAGMSDASLGAANDIGQAGAVFPKSDMPTGHAPVATKGYLREMSHLDRETSEYYRPHHPVASGHNEED